MCVCDCSALLSSSLLNTIGAAQAHQKQPWRSHSNAVSRHWVAKQHRTTCAAATPSAATPTRFCKEAYKVNVPVLTQCGQCLEISFGEDKPTLYLWFKGIGKHYEWVYYECIQTTEILQMPKHLHFRSGAWNCDVKLAWILNHWEKAREAVHFSSSAKRNTSRDGGRAPSTSKADMAISQTCGPDIWWFHKQRWKRTAGSKAKMWSHNVPMSDSSVEN